MKCRGAGQYQIYEHLNQPRNSINSASQASLEETNAKHVPFENPRLFFLSFV